ncbi:MAG: ABC-F family ATP-binding cassette domain-containing protein [Spirochaetales bacterium]|nr:ABC-F family ATP-binding cassette domain-containing protein [Spirochaetales bacterium]
MSFAQLSRISLAFGPRDILKDLSLTISGSSRTALTGGNGSGKTTLMKIIAGLNQPDSGDIRLQRDTHISYLPQSGITHAGMTLVEEVEKAFIHLKELLSEKQNLESNLASVKEHDSGYDQLIHQHHEIEEQLLGSGYYQREERIEQVLAGLGFFRQDFGKLCEEFSGGWQMRIALAKVLLEQPDILLLDEPTNYLDIEARDWLEGFLKKFSGGLLIVSHDRFFLDVTVNEVIELFQGEIHRYKGNFSAYEKTREAELASLLADYKQQQEEIKRIEDFINRFRYNANKAPLVQSRIKQLAKIERIVIPENMKRIHFTFPLPPHSGRRVLEISSLSRSYGDNVIFNGFDFLLEKGEKMVVAGKNGSGKSTLLRLIAGRDRDFQGEISFGTGVKAGYFSQDMEDDLDPLNSVIEEIESVAPTQMIDKLRDLLGAFLFRGDDIYKKVGVLSGGEKNRTALIKLLLHPANMLILDEPTNHLDMISKDVLLDALRQYKGTLIFVSHDRYFIEGLTTRVLELSPKGPRNFPGDYSYYLWKTSTEVEEVQTSLKSQPSTGRMNREEEKRIKGAIRRLKREEHELLEKLETLESEHQKIQEEMARPEIYTNGEVVRELKDKLTENEIFQEKLSARWEEVEEKLHRAGVPQ